MTSPSRTSMSASAPTIPGPSMTTFVPRGTPLHESYECGSWPGQRFDDEVWSDGTIEALPASLDSRIWKGGRPTFAAFTADFRLKAFTGANAAAEAQTSSLELVPGGCAFLSGVRLESNADDFTISVATAPFHGAPESWSAPASYHALTGMTPLMLSARIHRFRVDIAAGDEWMHLAGVDVSGFVQPDGQL